jgi:hypothetical protein
MMHLDIQYSTGQTCRLKSMQRGQHLSLHDGPLRAAHLWWPLEDLKDEDPEGLLFLTQAEPGRDVLLLSRPRMDDPTRSIVVMTCMISEVGTTGDILTVTAHERLHPDAPTRIPPQRSSGSSGLDG